MELKSLTKHLENSIQHVEGLLGDAMRYALLGDGKRIRPQLVLACARTCAPHLTEAEIITYAMPAALAVEYIHAYSLIHDDLPALDNDDFRRGKPSCHKQFGEATAILAGDALLSDAFRLLASGPAATTQQCAELSSAIGSSGMVLGQMLDIQGLAIKNDDQMLRVHALKTAKLFECACVLGAMSVGASREQVEAIRRYGNAYGIAFQLADDWADERQDEGLAKLLQKSIGLCEQVAHELPDGDRLPQFVFTSNTTVALTGIF